MIKTKTLKKELDKSYKKWYNRQAALRSGEDHRKKDFEKTSEKGLTKESGCDIIEKLVCKRLVITEKSFLKKLWEKAWQTTLKVI